MSKLAEHTFTFTAEQIAKAASDRADYHGGRQTYWEREYELAVGEVSRTCGAKVVRQEVTGGARAEVVVDFGDPVAYRRMQEAFRKVARHREDAARFATDAAVYGSQQEGRPYELSMDDVHHLALVGDPDDDEADADDEL